jgi:hypothetical protein
MSKFINGKADDEEVGYWFRWLVYPARHGGSVVIVTTLRTRQQSELVLIE